MADINIAVALQIGFNAETLAAIDRLAGMLGRLPSSPAFAASPVQPEAPGNAAHLTTSPLKPAEGPSRAAGEPRAGRSPKPPRVISKKPMSPERLAVLRANAAKGRAAWVAKLEAAKISPPTEVTRAVDITLVDPVIASPVTESFETRKDTIRRIAASLPGKQNPPPVVPKGEPIIAGQEAIRQWAAQRGVIMDAFDLDAVNAKAAALGHPGFVLKQLERRAR